MEDRTRAQFKDIWKEMGNEERKAAVHEELKRMNQLPPNSSYVTHRVRVLNKILQLISLQNYSAGPGVGVALCWAVSVNYIGKLK